MILIILMILFNLLIIKYCYKSNRDYHKYLKFWSFTFEELNKKQKYKLLLKEKAYILNKMYQQQICPISLNKFNKSFDQSLLICGHRFDKKSLNQYEIYNINNNKINQCPICRNNYLINKNKYNFNYDFYSKKSVFSFNYNQIYPLDRFLGSGIRESDHQLILCQINCHLVEHEIYY